MTYKSIIIDDEAFNRQQLRFELEDIAPEINVVAEAANGIEALRQIKIYQPELIFLDVEMPEMNGIEMLENIENPCFQTIFITAFDKYAIKAIRFSALDYLLKPIKSQELADAIARFKKRQLNDFNPARNYHNLVENIKTKTFKLSVNTNEGTLFFDPNEIIFLEGQANYTKFYFCNKKTFISSLNLKNYEYILAEHGFIRIHKSLIINKLHIEKQQGMAIYMKNHDQPLEIAKRRKTEVLGEIK